MMTLPEKLEAAYLETAEVVVLLRLLDGFEEGFVREVLRHGMVAHIAVADTDHLADVLLVCSRPKLLRLHLLHFNG